MKASIWKKPGTNDVRVYFNGIGGDVKTFAIEEDSRFVIKFSRSMYPSQQDALLDSIDRELEAMNGGERVIQWGDLLNLAK